MDRLLLAHIPRKLQRKDAEKIVHGMFVYVISLADKLFRSRGC